MATTLNIVESAYRATIEEQDDTVIWISHALKGAGAELTVLLRGNAVNYAIAGQGGINLVFGAWQQNHASKIDEDILSLIGKGVSVYISEQDLEIRGIAQTQLISGVKTVGREGILDLIEQHDRVWHW